MASEENGEKSPVVYEEVFVWWLYFVRDIYDTTIPEERVYDMTREIGEQCTGYIFMEYVRGNSSGYLECFDRIVYNEIRFEKLVQTPDNECGRDEVFTPSLSLSEVSSLFSPSLHIINTGSADLSNPDMKSMVSGWVKRFVKEHPTLPIFVIFSQCSYQQNHEIDSMFDRRLYVCTKLRCVAKRDCSTGKWEVEIENEHCIPSYRKIVEIGDDEKPIVRTFHAGRC